MYHVRKYKKSLALNQDNIYREKFSGFRMVSKNNMEVWQSALVMWLSGQWV